VCFSAIDEDCCWRKPSQWYGDHDCGQCLDAAHQAEKHGEDSTGEDYTSTDQSVHTHRRIRKKWRRATSVISDDDSECEETNAETGSMDMHELIRFRAITESEEAEYSDAGVDGIVMQTMRPSTNIRRDFSVNALSIRKVLAPDKWVEGDFITLVLEMYRIAGNQCSTTRTNYSLTTFFVDYAPSKSTHGLARELIKTAGEQNFTSLSLVFLPVNVNSNHWLVVVLDIAHQDVRVYDSLLKSAPMWKNHCMYDESVTAVEKFVQAVTMICSTQTVRNDRYKFAVQGIKTARYHGMAQADEVNCGVFLLTTVRSLIEGRLPVYNSDMTEQRKLLVLEATRGKLLPFDDHFEDATPPFLRGSLVESSHAQASRGLEGVDDGTSGTDEEERKKALEKNNQLRNRLLKQKMEKVLQENHADLPRVIKVGLRIHYYIGDAPTKETVRTGVVIEVEPKTREFYIKPDGISDTHVLGDETTITIARDDGIDYQVHAHECKFERGVLHGGKATSDQRHKDWLEQVQRDSEDALMKETNGTSIGHYYASRIQNQRAKSTPNSKINLTNYSKKISTQAVKTGINLANYSLGSTEQNSNDEKQINLPNYSHTYRQLTPSYSQTSTRGLVARSAESKYVSLSVCHFELTLGTGLFHANIAENTFVTAKFHRVRDSQPKYAYTVRALAACGLPDNSTTVWITDLEQRNGRLLWNQHGGIRDMLYVLPNRNQKTAGDTIPAAASILVYRTCLNNGQVRTIHNRPLTKVHSKHQIIAGLKMARTRLTTCGYPGPTWKMNSCHLDVFLVSELAFYTAHIENIIGGADTLPNVIVRLLRVLITLGHHGPGLLQQDFWRDDYREYELQCLKGQSSPGMVTQYRQADYVWHGELITSLADADGHHGYVEVERMLGCGVVENCTAPSHHVHGNEQGIESTGSTHYSTFVPIHNKWFPMTTLSAQKSLDNTTFETGRYGVDHTSYQDSVMSMLVRPMGDAPRCDKAECKKEGAIRSYEKKTSAIRFPRSLELDVGKKNVPSAWTNTFELKFGNVEYDLIAITMQSQCHYILICKLGDAWWLYDDLKKEKNNTMTNDKPTLHKIGYTNERVTALIERYGSAEYAFVPRTWRYALRPTSMNMNNGATWDTSIDTTSYTKPCYDDFSVLGTPRYKIQKD
jgi:hypothetical protein